MPDSPSASFRIETIAIQAIEASPVAFAIIDDHFRYILVNRAYASIFDLEVEDLTGQSIEEIVGTEEFEKSIKKHAQQCLIGNTVKYDREFFPGRWMDVTLTPLFDNDQKVYAFTASFRDITAQREESEAMRRALTLMQQAENIASIGHWLWDISDTKPLEYSDNLHQIIDVTESEMQMVNFSGNTLDRIHPEDNERMRLVTRLVLETGQPYDEQYRLLLKNGEYRWLHELCTPFETIDGKVTKLLGTTRDITQEKNREQALQHSMELSRLASRMTRVGHMLWDEINDRCLECSDVIPEIHGLTKEEYIRRGASIKGMLHIAEEDREWLREEYRKSSQPGEYCDVTYRVVRDDGEFRWVREVFAPYQIEKGRVLTSIGTIRDITQEVMERESLERERVFIQQVEDVIGVGVFIWDENEQRNIYCSDSLADMHGMTKEEMLTSVIGEEADVNLVHPEDRERVAEVYKNTRLYGHPIDVEYRIEHPERGMRWYNEVAVKRTIGDDNRLVTMGLMHDITDRKKIEEEIQFNQVLISQAEGLGKLGFWIVDIINDDFTMMSDQIPAMYGLSKSKYLEVVSTRENHKKLIHPEDVSRVFDAYDQCKEDGKSFDVEYRIIHSNGQVRWVHETGAANMDSKGQISIMLGTMRDINTQKLVEQNLRQRDVLFGQIEESFDIGYWLWSSQPYGLIYISDAYCQIFNASRDEILNESRSLDGTINMIHPEDQERISNVLLKSEKTSEPYEEEYRIVRNDGEVRWVHETMKPLISASDGTLLESVGTMRDITIRKQREEELRQRDILFGQIEENFDVGFWSWDNDKYELRYASDSYCRIFGLSREEIIKRSSTLDGEMEAIHPDDRERIRDANLQFEKNPVPYEEEFKIIRGDGEIRWVQEVSAPLNIADDGSLVTSVGTLRDITELKMREDELRHEKERAEFASKAKSEFLAHMSHELRTPLNAVLGFTDAIRTELFGPLGDNRYQEYMENIQSSGRLLLSLINDLLDMSAIEAGELSINPERQNMAPLVTEMLELVNPSANAKGIELTWSSELAAMDLMVDPRRFRQIILNLLTNAVKYTPEGGDISIIGYTDKNGSPIIEVKDTGIGMSDEEMEAALIPFKQIRNAKVRRVEGTGIGLPLSRQLAELHDGKLIVASEKGKGTTVSIVLPEKSIVH